jgi:hypothetical protein
MQQMNGSWGAVELLERPADNFDGLPEASFDTVVINSVTHYFPNILYLAKVMDGAARVLKPGGHIFVGDVRSLPLLEAYATSVELFQAANEMELAELRERVARRINQEEQLVISPAFFRELAQRNPKLSGAEIRLKRGRSDNELTRFRYDVVLHASSKEDRNTKLEWSDWRAAEEGIEEIQRRLKDEKPASVAIAGIRNARIEKDIAALARLSSADVKGTVGQMKGELDKAAPSGLRPEDICSAGEAAGYGVQLSWTSCQPDGRYDAFLWRSDGSAEKPKPLIWPQPSSTGAEFTKYTNVPGQSVFRERLVQNLLSYCKENLPEDLVPGTLIVVEALPS